MKNIAIFILCLLAATVAKAQDWGDDPLEVQYFLWEDNGEPTGQNRESLWYAWEDGYQEVYLFNKGGLFEVQTFEEFDDVIKEYEDQKNLLMLEHEIIESYDDYSFNYTYEGDRITVYVDNLKKNVVTIIKKVLW